MEYTEKDKLIYGKGKIYAIKSKNTSDIYIGSTVLDLSKCLQNHIESFNELDNYCSSFRVIECGDYWIELIQKYPCQWKEELLSKQQEWIDYFAENCVNERRAITTREEKLDYKKQYYNENKERLNEKSHKWYNQNRDQMKEYSKQYYIDNKDKIIARDRVEIRCECGFVVQKSDLARHKRTARHKNYLINKDKIESRQKVEIRCECGVIISKRELPRHKRTQRHQSYLSRQS